MWQLDQHFIADDSVVPLGNTVHYIGIFEPINVPMARTGAMGATDVPVDKTEHGVRYQYRGDLIDCRSYAGFSGSPCVATLTYALLDDEFPLPPSVPPRRDGSYPKLVRTATLGTFCGILTQHWTDESAPDAHGAVSRFGVCVMLPSHYIRTALMSDEAKAERVRWDQSAV